MNEEYINSSELVEEEIIQEVQKNPIYNNDYGVEVDTSTSTPKEKSEKTVVPTNATGSVIIVDGKEVNYYEKAYEEQLKTNLYLNLILVGISTILILKWVYGGIKRMFHVTIN